MLNTETDSAAVCVEYSTCYNIISAVYVEYSAKIQLFLSYYMSSSIIVVQYIYTTQPQVYIESIDKHPRKLNINLY